MWTCGTSQIARFMGPTWGPPGSCRPPMGPMLAPWTLLSGVGVFTLNDDFALSWETESMNSSGQENTRGNNLKETGTGAILPILAHFQPMITGYWLAISVSSLSSRSPLILTVCLYEGDKSNQRRLTGFSRSILKWTRQWLTRNPVSIWPEYSLIVNNITTMKWFNMVAI